MAALHLQAAVICYLFSALHTSTVTAQYQEWKSATATYSKERGLHHHWWCNFPRAHFQMPEAAFSLIAQQKAYIVSVQYRRVQCKRKGGIRFTLKGRAYFMQVLITNVGLDGEIVAVKVKGSRTIWVQMERNWQCNTKLAGQPLSFEVTTASSITLATYNVAPQTGSLVRHS
ncbi:UNVERIFIED_CONTAM: Expansin-A16 [Sesamum indicum]